MKAGIPRAYDANLDAKTPFHIRGDERNADKDRVVKPGLPAVPRPGWAENHAGEAAAARLPAWGASA